MLSGCDAVEAARNEQNTQGNFLPQTLAAQMQADVPDMAAIKALRNVGKLLPGYSDVTFQRKVK